ncbi:MAG: hypothetical protein AB3N63_02440 [Puniceicoccaceae bacterium]
MKRILTYLTLLSLLLAFVPGTLAAKVMFNGKKYPPVAFAAQELKTVIAETGNEDLQVMLVVKPDESSPESYQIRWFGEKDIRVIGTDANGTMYGGLEIAEQLRLGLPIEDKQHVPFVKKRGIKWNIPLDARIPSYDDTGDSAQKNIESVWDFEFWKAYLDDLARYRYNVLSLWATHPFPSLIQLDEYPDVALDDVYRISDGTLNPVIRNKWQGLDLDTPGVLELVKEMPIEEKIKHWQRVFKYAEDRGIEIYVFCWNVFTWYAEGKYGITQEQDNPHTIKYIRECVKELFRTYPQIAGFGVTAGENADWFTEGEYSAEGFVYKTFGKGIMDVQREQPGRQIRFIFRRHVTDHPAVTAAFKDYTGGDIDTSIKYSVAHTFSSRRPQEWETRIVEEGWLEAGYKAWLNLRNDDIFMHRWGSADYVREFIRWMPHEHMRGFYMGSDGYVWAREFIAKNPEMSGKLEIEKHWYQFRLWGQLAYDNDLPRSYWEATLKHRFPEVDAALLYDTWASTSEIVPQLNRASWSPTDAAFSAEGCMERAGFLGIDEYYFNRPTMPLRRILNPPDPQCISVTDWAKAMLAGEEVDGVTPMQVADNLDGWAANSLKVLTKLRAQAGNNLELKETLNDIESMAYLGRYYADKQRGAAKVALFRESGRKEKKYLDQAVAHLEDAIDEWKTYALVLDRQYKPSLLARTHYLDWHATLEHVKQEAISVKNESDPPTLQIVNLKDGQKFKVGSDLEVQVKAGDSHGLKYFKLYLDGQLLKGEKRKGDTSLWSSNSDSLLKNMQPGLYHFRAVVEDNTGIRKQQELEVTVGDATGHAGNWRNEIYQVILEPGKRFEQEDMLEIPRLECYFRIDEEGGFLQMGGSPGDSPGFIWKTRGKADRPTPQPVPPHFYLIIEEGQLKVYRVYPGREDVAVYAVGRKSDAGGFKLGITGAKRLVVYREENGRKDITWMSPFVN